VGFFGHSGVAWRLQEVIFLGSIFQIYNNNLDTIIAFHHHYGELINNKQRFRQASTFIVNTRPLMLQSTQTTTVK
jgi:hypothetical protein